MKSFKKINILAMIFLVMASASVNAVDPKSPEKKNDNNILKDGDSAFIKPYGDWKFEDNMLILPVKNKPENRTNIWLKDDYTDFVIELDFKLDAGTNTGLFFRTTNIKNEVQTGIEIQLRDDYGKSPIDPHFCGSIYEISQTYVNVVNKPLEWNHLKLTAKGSRITVLLNNVTVNDIDLSQWTEVGKNPDGTTNKFKTAFCNMAQTGKIGFQDHGGKAWYKNINIKEL